MSAEHRFSSVVMAGLAAVILATFWPVLSAGFLLNDDPLNITGVRPIRELSLANLRWMFFDFGPDIRYKPITYLSWALVHSVFGMKAFYFHLANLLLHVVNAGLLFLLVLRTARLIVGEPVEGTAGRFRMLSAGIVALFWAVHPLRVETVAWLSVLSYSLTAFFLQLALLSFLGCDHQRSLFRQGWYWWTLGLFQLAMMSFPTAIGFSLVFLALRMLNGMTRRAWVELLPFFALSGLMVGVGLYGQLVEKGIWGEPVVDVPAWMPVLGPVYYLAYYAWRPFYPVKHFTLNEDLLGIEATDPRLLCAVLLVIGAVMWGCKSRVRLAFLVAWVGALAPVLNFTGGTPLPSDRYSLLPGMLLAVALHGFVISRPASARPWLALVLGVYCVAFTFLSRERSRVWQDDETFFADRVAQTRSTVYRVQAHRFLGQMALDQGDDAKGLRHLEAAWELDPEFCAEAMGLEYGELLIEHGLLERAARVLSRTRKENRDDYLVGLRLAYVLLRQGRTDAVRALVDEVVASESYARGAIAGYLFEAPPAPEVAGLMDLVGRAHLRRDEISEADEVYSLMIDDAPDSAEPFLAYARATKELLGREAASKIIKRGIERFPDDAALIEMKAQLP